MVEPLAAAVVAHNPALDDVIVVPRRGSIRGLLEDVELGRRLRAQHFDLVIDFHGGPRSSLMAWLSRAPTRVGYQVRGRGWMYTTRVARPKEIRARHAVENQWDLLNAIGIPTPDPTYSPTEMTVDRDAARAVGERLATMGVREGDELIVLHVSAGNPFRRWPPDSFASLIAMLLRRRTHRRVIVVAGASDRDSVARVMGETLDRIEIADRGRLLSADFTLDELRALMDRAALYIGGDSGPLHIASTTTVPIVGLYGPTLPVRSQPWRAPQWPSEAVEVDGLPCRPCNQRVCEPGDFRCLTRLTPEHVLQAAERALDRAATITGSH
jgi:ADP-heptose:LPS heptosyltransferase